ncbi:TPA: TIGR02594 family protein [Stenotrophomonas maltophilia]
MPTYISAVFNKDTRTVEFTADNGDKLIRSGGSLAWLLNNPGNLRPGGKYAKMIGQADTKSGKFAIFPTAEDGRAEKRALLRRKYNDMTLYNAMHTYAPESENDTAAYLAYVRKRSGATDQTVIKDMTDEQFNGMIAAMEQYEGFNAKPETRKERIVHATQVTLSDGARPMPATPVIVRSSNTGEKKVTTNEHGALPTFITRQPGEVIELFLEESGKIGSRIGQFALQQASASLVFARNMMTVGGNSQPHTPTQPSKEKRTPLRYVVQPGDTLASIASRFKTSVDDLVSNNHIRNRNRIYPGHVVWIYGKAPADAANDGAPATPTRSRQASYSVRSGDTLSRIADRHHTSVDALMAANPSISNANRINPGQKITLPVGVEAVPPSAAGSSGRAGNSGNPQTSDRPSLVKPPPETPAAAVRPPASVQARDTRSREGEGHPIAIIPFSQKRAPWVEHAYAQARKWAGKKEAEISRTINFHSELGYGKQFTTLAGSSNAWCASFVNWCLRTAGYAISSPHPYRARSFAADTTRFSQIDEPVFGAVALVGTSHVGFVYAIDRGRPVLLGGNQSDQINFVRFNPATLRYYVPKSYLPFAQKELKETKLDELAATDLNAALGIVVAKKAGDNTR